jgi:hypothetical protein
MGWGITFTASLSRVKADEIKERIAILENLQQRNKLEFYIHMASTPEHNYDGMGVFQHKTDFIKERSDELWEAITETAHELSLLYAALNATDVIEY